MLPVGLAPGDRKQPPGRGYGLCLHPEIFIGIAEITVRCVAIDQPTMDLIPALFHRPIEQPAGAFNMPALRSVSMQLQDQFCPFNLMPGLIAPRLEQIIRLVDVVVPIMLPVICVMFPDLAVGRGCHCDGKFTGNYGRAIKITCLPRAFIGGKQCLNRMHVGVLPPVG